MLPQIGFAEMLVIAILALVVVGPKDLPGLLRKAGQIVGKMKALGQEFKSAFDEMGQEEELADLKREIEELKSMGQLSNLSDEAFEEDMRALDQDLNQVTDLGLDDVPKASKIETSELTPKKTTNKKKKSGPKKKAGIKTKTVTKPKTKKVQSKSTTAKKIKSAPKKSTPKKPRVEKSTAEKSKNGSA